MNVRELRDLLSQYPDDMLVLGHHGCEAELADFGDYEDVEYLRTNAGKVYRRPREIYEGSGWMGPYVEKSTADRMQEYDSHYIRECYMTEGEPFDALILR